MKIKALVVLSGGQDSTTCLYWAKTQYTDVRAICFDYGQRHSIELDSARTIAKLAEVPLELVSLRGLLRSTSPLVDQSVELERYKDAKDMEKVIGDRVELTFVPMRNTMFLVVAANYALSWGCRTLVTGICQEDNANYPDCTELFRSKVEATFNESLGVGNLEILAPLMNLSKAQSVKLATTLPGCMQALAYSHTSYDGKYPPTDMNHANVLRAEGFAEAGEPDPLVLRAWREGLMDLPPGGNYDETRNRAR